MRDLDSGLPVYIETWNKELDNRPVCARGWRRWRWVCMGVMGAMLSVTGIFGMAAYSVSKRKRELGIRMALGAQRKEVLQARWDAQSNCWLLVRLQGCSWEFWRAGCWLPSCIKATPRDPLVLAGVVLAMSFVGLLATWIPAQRALSLDPLTLLREE